MNNFDAENNVYTENEPRENVALISWYYAHGIKKSIYRIEKKEKLYRGLFL